MALTPVTILTSSAFSNFSATVSSNAIHGDGPPISQRLHDASARHRPSIGLA
jgi:hypothetical protein